MKTKSIFNFRESDSHDTASRVSQTTLEHAMLPEVSLAMNQHRALFRGGWPKKSKINRPSAFYQSSEISTYRIRERRHKRWKIK